MSIKSSKKRILSFVLAFMTCLALFPAIALAEEAFPPTTLEPPTGLILSIPKPDHGKYVYVTFNKNEKLSSIIDRKNELRDQYNLDYLDFYIQIDWSIDSQDDWTYHPNWDVMESSAGGWFEGEYFNISLSSDTTERKSILNQNYKPDPNSPKWKQLTAHLKEEHYSIDDRGEFYIDWTRHTVYVRARFVIYYKPKGGDKQYLISDWSPVAAYGKDYKPFEIPDKLEPPIISDLKLTDRILNGGPVAAFTLKNPESVKAASVGAKSLTDYIIAAAEVSIGGSEWKEVNLTDRDITDGNFYAELARTAEKVTEDTHVKLRARYQYHKGNGTLVLTSDWSNVIEFGAPAWGLASEWAAAELKNAGSLGLIPDSLRGADLTKPITRAEFAAVCVKVYEALAGTKALPAVNNPFKDTNDIEILKAYNLGATTGTASDKFSPDLLLNREQMATMLTRVFKRVTLPGWTIQTDSQFTLPYTKPAPFADDDKISSWAKDSVYFMVANEIIKGTGNNIFSPRATTSEEEARNYATATREQALVIAVRMVANLK